MGDIQHVRQGVVLGGRENHVSRTSWCVYSHPILINLIDPFLNADDLVPYFTRLGFPCPSHTNPADHVIGLINTDFTSADPDKDDNAPNAAEARLNRFAATYRTDASGGQPHLDISLGETRQRRTATSQTHSQAALDPKSIYEKDDTSEMWAARNKHRMMDELNRTWLLIQRTALNYRRNILAYGIRLAMYSELNLGCFPLAVDLTTKPVSRDGFSACHHLGQPWLFGQEN